MNNRRQGILYIIMAGFFFALMTFFVRLSGDLPTMEKAFFRNAETGALMELVGQPPCVVSTGGGLCTIAENVTIMKNHGVIIHIDRPLDQILSDIKTDRRPNLAGGTHEDVIDLYNRRIGYYRAAADYRLDNSKGFVMGVKNLTELAESLEAEGL